MAKDPCCGAALASFPVLQASQNMIHSPAMISVFNPEVKSSSQTRKDPRVETGKSHKKEQGPSWGVHILERA